MATKIIDGLFLGDLESAHDVDFLVSNKVTHIINCCGRVNGAGGSGRRGGRGGARVAAGGYGNYNNKPWERIGIKYLVYHWQSSTTFDGSEANVVKFSSFIDAALEGCTSVLVHSRDGASRACSVIAAYLMQKLLWGVEQTLEYMRVKRHDLNPTLPARRQLFDVQRRLEVVHGNDERIITRLTSTSWALPNAAPEMSDGTGGGVTTTNNDISSNNDSIRISGAKGVETSLKKIESIFDATTALEVMTIMNTHVNSLQPRDLPKPRRQRKSAKISWIDSRHAGGSSSRRHMAARSTNTGKPAPVRPPGESYHETIPGPGWLDTMHNGSKMQRYNGQGGRHRAGMGNGHNPKYKGPGSATDGLFHGKPRRSALKSAKARNFDRVTVEAAKRAEAEAETKARARANNRARVVNTKRNPSLSNAAESNINISTGGTTVNNGPTADASVTDGEGSLISPANEGVQWRTDTVAKNGGNKPSGSVDNKSTGEDKPGFVQSRLGEVTSSGDNALDLQSPGESLAASLMAQADIKAASSDSGHVPTPVSGAALNWHGVSQIPSAGSEGEGNQDKGGMVVASSRLSKQRRPGTPGTAAARAQRLKRRGANSKLTGTAPRTALLSGTSPTRVDSLLPMKQQKQQYVQQRYHHGGQQPHLSKLTGGGEVDRRTGRLNESSSASGGSNRPSSAPLSRRRTKRESRRRVRASQQNNYDYSLSVTGNSGSKPNAARYARRKNNGGREQVKRRSPSQGSQRQSRRPMSASTASLAYSSSNSGRKRAGRRGASPMSRSSASASRLNSSYGTSSQPQYRRQTRTSTPVRSTGLRGSGMASLYSSNNLGVSRISFGQGMPSFDGAGGLRRPASASGHSMDRGSFSVSSRMWRS